MIILSERIQFKLVFSHPILLQKYHQIHFYKRISFLIFIICFTVFVFSNDGHRHTFDEDVAHQQSYRISTFENDPSYVQGESRIFFEYTWLFPPEHNLRAICQNGILCSAASVVHSVTQVPFISLNHVFNFISDDIKWDVEDFDDFDYLNWRNSMNPDFIFLELFYGPFFSALTIAVFFLICRLYKISTKNSIFSSFLLGFASLIFPYSQTSLSVVPMVFFSLLGYYFFKKYLLTNLSKPILLSGICFGLAYLTRPDAILFIIPLFFILIFYIKSKPKKIHSFLSFLIPIVSSYGIDKIITYIKVGSTKIVAVHFASKVAQGSYLEHSTYAQNIFGILFSPGAGLFVYCPILVACLVGFFDFFKKFKIDTIILLSFSVFFILWYSAGDTWHGFVGWGPRYLIPIVPFLFLPIAFSINQRGLFFKSFIIFLGSLGFVFNLIYILQDVTWFVWGFFGSDERGLYSLGRTGDGGTFPLWINPIIIWSLEYNQLTQSIMWIFSKLQVDLFLLKLLGIQIYIVAFLSLLTIPTYLLLRNIFSKTKLEKSL